LGEAKVINAISSSGIPALFNHILEFLLGCDAAPKERIWRCYGFEIGHMALFYVSKARESSGSYWRART
jgi:hypothetical protein